MLVVILEVTISGKVSVIIVGKYCEAKIRCHHRDKGGEANLSLA
jgi:hypothetical protein